MIQPAADCPCGCGGNSDNHDKYNQDFLIGEIKRRIAYQPVQFMASELGISDTLTRRIINKNKLWIARKDGIRQCAREGCGNKWQITPRNYKSKFFCSQKCKDAWARHLRIIQAKVVLKGVQPRCSRKGCNRKIPWDRALYRAQTCSGRCNAVKKSMKHVAEKKVRSSRNASRRIRRDYCKQLVDGLKYECARYDETIGQGCYTGDCFKKGRRIGEMCGQNNSFGVAIMHVIG